MATIGENMQAVKRRIARAAAAAGRDPASICLLAVSKTHSAERIAEACSSGVFAIGENYVQEAIPKMQTVSALLGGDGAAALEWHLIGPLQHNKTRIVAEHFQWVQTIDRSKTGRRLSEQRPAGLAPLNVLIQVNISNEPSKSGVSPQGARELAHELSSMPGLRLRGLMGIPEPTGDTTLQRERFRALHVLFRQTQLDGFPLDTLSMGMSDDLESAVAEGSTMVRIGTAIFGQRERPVREPQVQLAGQT